MMGEKKKFNNKPFKLSQLVLRPVTVNLIQDEGKEWAKSPPHASFSPATYPKVGISTQNILTFWFLPFCHTAVKFQADT